jgi:hypothetical protein
MQTFKLNTESAAAVDRTYDNDTTVTSTVLDFIGPAIAQAVDAAVAIDHDTDFISSLDFKATFVCDHTFYFLDDLILTVRVPNIDDDIVITHNVQAHNN